MDDIEANGPKPRPSASRRLPDGGVLSDEEAERRASEDYAERQAERERIKKMHKGSATAIKLDPSPIEPSTKRRYEPSRQN